MHQPAGMHVEQGSNQVVHHTRCCRLVEFNTLGDRIEQISSLNDKGPLTLGPKDASYWNAFLFSFLEILANYQVGTSYQEDWGSEFWIRP